MNQIIDFDSRKKSNKKQKTAKSAARWNFLENLLESGLATITIAGQVLNKDEIQAFVSYIDDQIKETKRKERAERERIRRKVRKRTR